MLTSIFIRGQIDFLHGQDADIDGDDLDHVQESDLLCDISANASGLPENAFLGAAQPPCTFRELEQSHLQDVAFTRFRLRFRDFLDILLRRPDSPIKMQHNRPLSIDAEQLVSNSL